MAVSLVCDPVADRLIVGSYPQSVEDLEFLSSQYGVTAVLSLQSDDDLRAVAQAADALWMAGMQRGIAMVRVPILDFVREDLLTHLEDAVDTLADLMNTGNTVYLHCTAGLNRSPTVAIAYLARHQNLGLDAASKQVRTRHRCMPYEDVVARWLDTNPA